MFVLVFINVVYGVITVITKDNSCGIYSTNTTVCNPNGPGPCCSNSITSSSGWCGSTSAYCGVGNCILNCTTVSATSSKVIITLSTTSTSISNVIHTTVSSSIPTVITTDNSCGIYSDKKVVCSSNGPGPCCSNSNGQNGWCGSTSIYCLPQNCLFNCSSAPIITTLTTTSTIPIQTTATKLISTDGTCSLNTICPNQQCCSSAGWCGNDVVHCGTGCQSQCVYNLNYRLDYWCNSFSQLTLTFDDGPSVYSNDVAVYLNSIGVKATFFMIGQNMIQYPDIVKSIFNLGHFIGVHTWTHPHMTTLDNSTALSELTKTIDYIVQLTGVKPRYWRPPYSDYNNVVLELAHSVGLNTVLFNLDSGDWQSNNITYIQSLILNGLVSGNTNGGILDIMHDIHSEVLNITKYTVNNSNKYQIVDLLTCIGI